MSPPAGWKESPGRTPDKPENQLSTSSKTGLPPEEDSRSVPRSNRTPALDHLSLEHFEDFNICTLIEHSRLQKGQETAVFGFGRGHVFIALLEEVTNLVSCQAAEVT